MAAKFQLVRYKAGKSTYEAICKPGTVLKFRQGKLGIDKVLESDDVWTNQQKGERPSDSDLEAAFGTSNPKECLLKIVSDGEVQLTAAERKEKVDKKRAEMINYLHKYYIDPRSNKPHPVVRLEEAFSQLKVRVDPDTPADRQVQDVVKKLPEILPVKKSEIELTLFVPHKHLGQVQGLMHDYAKVLSENWSGSGCSMQLTLTPGDFDHFNSEINKMGQGEITMTVTSSDAMASSDIPEEETTGKRGKGKSRRGKGKGGRR